MLPKTHLWTALIISALAALFGITTLLQSAAILFGGILIDTDHYLNYAFSRKDWSLKHAYKWHYALYLSKAKIVHLHIFHTIESFIAVFLLGYLHPMFFYVLAGMIFHMILDIIQAIDRRFYGKRISILCCLFNK